MAGAYNKWALLVIVWVLSVALTEAQITQTCTWTFYPNTNINGGTANPATSLAACQAACRSTSGCVSIDWTPGNTAGQQCVLQTTTCGKNSNVTGVNHYDIYVCGGCTWVSYPNTLIYRGTVNPANCLTACQAACAATPGCAGIDWAPGNAAGQQCFLQTTQSGKQSNVTGVNHYDYVCNGCTWVYYANTLIYGGTVNSANSLTACQSACQSTSGCVGVDWAPNNTAGNQCFTQTTQSPKNTNAPGVDHYDYVCNGTNVTASTGTGTTIPGTATTSSSSANCSSSQYMCYQPMSCMDLSDQCDGVSDCLNPPDEANCSCYWNVTTGTYIVGGTNNPATSLAACQATCVNASMPPPPGPNPGPNPGGCKSIDWVWSAPSGFQCLLQSTQMNKTVKDGVDHYDYICPAPVGPPASKACRISIEFYYDTSSPGGVNIPQIPNIDNCSSACSRLDSCAGLEYNPATGCWIHYKSADFDQMYYQAGVIQIRFNRCPADDVYTCNPAVMATLR